MPITTIARSRERLYKLGGFAFQTVQHYNPHTNKSYDLFRIIDIVAIGRGELIGVQATTIGCRQAHIDKALNEPLLRLWLEGHGKYEIWSWKRNLTSKSSEESPNTYRYELFVDSFSINKKTGNISYTRSFDRDIVKLSKKEVKQLNKLVDVGDDIEELIGVAESIKLNRIFDL